MNRKISSVKQIAPLDNKVGRLIGSLQSVSGTGKTVKWAVAISQAIGLPLSQIS